MKRKYYIITLPALLCVMWLLFIAYCMKALHPMKGCYKSSLEAHELVDTRPQVEQLFLQEYDSLTTASLKSFVDHWRLWSKEREPMASCSRIDQICKEVINRYERVSPDSASFYVYPYCIITRYSVGKFQKQDYYWDAKSFDGDTVYVVPAAIDGKPVLYLTPEIEKKLNDYLHWVYEFRDGQLYEEVHHDREEILRKYLPLGPSGDIPGYYTYYSYPMITEVTTYEDGAVVSVTIDPFNGEVLFFKDFSIGEAEVLSSWVV